MKITEITPTFSYTEFDYLKMQLSSFSKSELGHFHSLIPFDELSKSLKPLKRKTPIGRKNIFDIKGQIGLMFLKMKYNLSDKHLIERFNSDIHFQIFCDTIIPADAPLTNYKIVSKIRTQLSERIDLNKFQKVVATVLKQYIPPTDLRCVMSDATCYESYVSFPTNQKLLMSSIIDVYKILKKIVKINALRMPRSKYNEVSKAYLSFAKTRKKTNSKKIKITRRLLNLLDKLYYQYKTLSKDYKTKLSKVELSRVSVIGKILKQQKQLFEGEDVKCRIVSIDKPYVRPIVRGKENKNVEFGAKVNSIQVGGFNFIEHIDFNAFHEGIRVPACIDLYKMLFNLKPRYFAGDAIYATNKNRVYCKANNIITNFVPKGRKPKNDEMKGIRRILNIARSTMMEGSFGTEKENYSLRKIKARTKKNEILWILFGIHTANFSRLASRLAKQNKGIENQVA